VDERYGLEHVYGRQESAVAVIHIARVAFRRRSQAKYSHLPLRVLFREGAGTFSVLAEQRPRRQQGQLPGAALARGVPAARRLQGLLPPARVVVHATRLPTNEPAGSRGRPSKMSGQDEVVQRRWQIRSTVNEIYFSTFRIALMFHMYIEGKFNKLIVFLHFFPMRFLPVSSVYCGPSFLLLFPLFFYCNKIVS